MMSRLARVAQREMVAASSAWFGVEAHRAAERLPDFFGLRVKKGKPLRSGEPGVRLAPFVAVARE